MELTGGEYHPDLRVVVPPGTRINGLDAGVEVVRRYRKDVALAALPEAQRITIEWQTRY